MSRPLGRILVIRGGAIGDFILTLPALAALRRQFPGVPLEVLGYEHIAQLALAGGVVDAVRSIEARSLAGFFAREGQLASELKNYFARFAVIVSYLYDPDGIFQENVARCSPAQFIAGPHRPDEAKPLHAARVFLEPLERLAIFDADAVPRLSIRQRPPAHAAGGLALHPGSGSERKNWPESRWSELLQRLIRTTSSRLLIVGGEAEEQRLERLCAQLPRERFDLARSLPLPELAARLAGCAGFVGHDSGISHLAAAVGLPALILWGDTAEAVWRPASDRVTILRDPRGLAGLSVERVWQEIGAFGL